MNKQFAQLDFVFFLKFNNLDMLIRTCNGCKVFFMRNMNLGSLDLLGAIGALQSSKGKGFLTCTAELIFPMLFNASVDLSPARLTELMEAQCSCLVEISTSKPGYTYKYNKNLHFVNCSKYVARQLISKNPSHAGALNRNLKVTHAN